MDDGRSVDWVRHGRAGGAAALALRALTVVLQWHLSSIARYYNVMYASCIIEESNPHLVGP